MSTKTTLPDFELTRDWSHLRVGDQLVERGARLRFQMLSGHWFEGTLQIPSIWSDELGHVALHDRHAHGLQVQTIEVL